MKDTLLLYSLLKESDSIPENLFTEIECSTFDTALSDAERYVYIGTNNENGLVSLLSIIGNPNSRYYAPQKKWSIEQENGFPVSEENNYTTDLYEEYETELGKLLNNNWENKLALANTIFALQKQHLSNYLHGSKGTGSLSRFEFLKSRAAFAQCLQTPNIDTNSPFLIFCGDVSGIQEFIYNIYSRKAAKSIKGRSFYLQLLVDTITKRIINETQTTIANIIYSSGGKFFMLLPNTNEVQQQLRNLELEITTEIYNQHQGSLYVCMDFVKFNVPINQTDSYQIRTDERLLNGDTPNGLGDLWRLISEKTSLKKRDKFRALFLKDQSNFERFFKGHLNEDYDGENTAVCAVTGLPVAKEYSNLIDRSKTFNPNDENNVFVRPEVNQQVEIGEALKDADYYVSSSRSFNDAIEPLQLGIHHRLLSSTELQHSTAVEVINPTNDMDIAQLTNNNRRSVGFTFYGGNKQAINQETNEWKTFEELAEPDEGKSFNKLGILRMDVDNLNTIFTGERLRGNKYQTFATYSYLSAQFDWFFSGYLNTLRNNPNFADYVNILYAGGDDVCAVGRWDKIIEFAKQIQSDFAVYVQNDKITISAYVQKNKITISAGISIVNPKFPISKAIDMAKKALDKAKDYRSLLTQSLEKQDNVKKDADKNAIHLLDLTVNWEEFAFVWQLKELFYEMLQEGSISKGLVYKLFVFQQLKNDGLLDWCWQSAYTFAKLQNTKNPRQSALLKSLKESLMTSNFDFTFNTQKLAHEIKGNKAQERMLDLICLSAKLADYYSR